MPRPTRSPTWSRTRSASCAIVDSVLDFDYAAGRVSPAFRAGTRALFRSIQRVLALPAETRLFICDDCGPNGHAIRWETTVALLKRKKASEPTETASDMC